MEGETAHERTKIPVACDCSVLTAEQQERQRALYRQPSADVEEVRELEDGYTFKHPDVYGHLMPGMQEATLNTLDGVFS